ncbi:hypothetical protein [Methylocella sp.]|jgi:hypothetical protein|uniref:hypothetical protein n=1 Tax=Methylocella sp. TaxID=1978226 RepID=UPI003C26BBF4
MSECSAFAPFEQPKSSSQDQKSSNAPSPSGASNADERWRRAQANDMRFLLREKNLEDMCIGFRWLVENDPPHAERVARKAVFDFGLTLRSVLIGDYEVPGTYHGRSCVRTRVEKGITHELILRQCQRARINDVMSPAALAAAVAETLKWALANPGRQRQDRVGAGFEMTYEQVVASGATRVRATDYTEGKIKEQKRKCQRARAKKYRAGKGAQTRWAWKARVAKEKNERRCDREYDEGMAKCYAEEVKAAKPRCRKAKKNRAAKPMSQFEKYKAKHAEMESRNPSKPFPGESDAAFKRRCRGMSKSAFYRDREAIASGEKIKKARAKAVNKLIADANHKAKAKAARAARAAARKAARAGMSGFFGTGFSTPHPRLEPAQGCVTHLGLVSRGTHALLRQEEGIEANSGIAGAGQASATGVGSDQQAPAIQARQGRKGLGDDELGPMIEPVDNVSDNPFDLVEGPISRPSSLSPSLLGTSVSADVRDYADGFDLEPLQADWGYDDAGAA